MPLTPADIHNIAFKKPAIGKRGYDQEEVDAFLDDLEQELIRLIEENDGLRTMVARGGGGGAQPRPDTGVRELRARLDRLRREQAAAEQAMLAMRDQLDQARQRPAPTGEHESDVLTMAELTADNHLGEARRAAHDLLTDARSTAARITAEAQVEAESLERTARERHQAAMDALAAEHAATVQQIDELAALGQEYRARLRAHVDGQMRDLERPGRA